MITVLAYLVTFVNILLTGTIVGAVFVLLIPLEQRIDNAAFSGSIHLVDNALSRLIGVWLSAAAFSWLNIPFSAGALILPVAFYMIQDTGRVLRAWHSDAFFLEIGYGLGDLVGFPVAYLFASKYIGMTTLGLILLGLLLPAVWMYFASRAEGFQFWNLAGKLPEEAYAWFKSEDCWYLDVPDTKKGSAKIVGPFRLAIPSRERTICIWADADRLVDSQRRFVQKYRSQERNLSGG